MFVKTKLRVGYLKLIFYGGYFLSDFCIILNNIVLTNDYGGY